jgi:hypothetical protein
MTKAKACKGAGQEGSSGVTPHAPGNVRECEGMKPRTPKWIPTLGVKVLMDSQIFKERFVGVKTHYIEEFLISLEKIKM